MAEQQQGNGSFTACRAHGRIDERIQNVETAVASVNDKVPWKVFIWLMGILTTVLILMGSLQVSTYAKITSLQAHIEERAKVEAQILQLRMEK